MGSLTNRYADVVRICRERPRKNYDICMIISGGTGDGKSNLAIQIAMSVDPTFKKEMESRIAFSRDELFHLIDTLPKYSCIVVDEAVNVLFKRDFMKKGQKQLLRYLDMARQKNLVMFFNVPLMWSLDSHFVNSRVHLWLYVHKRGYSSLYKPLTGVMFAYIIDPWCRKQNQLFYSGHKFQKSPNYHGQVLWNKLPADLEARYVKVKEERSQTAHMEDEIHAREPKKKKES